LFPPCSSCFLARRSRAAGNILSPSISLYPPHEFPLVCRRGAAAPQGFPPSFSVVFICFPTVQDFFHSENQDAITTSTRDLGQLWAIGEIPACRPLFLRVPASCSSDFIRTRLSSSGGNGKRTWKGQRGKKKGGTHEGNCGPGARAGLRGPGARAARSPAALLALPRAQQGCGPSCGGAGGPWPCPGGAPS